MILSRRKAIKNVSRSVLNRFSGFSRFLFGFIRMFIFSKTDYSNKPAGFPNTSLNRFFFLEGAHFY